MSRTFERSNPGPGRFISFEGTEGGGKSTQIQILADRLRSMGRVVRSVREPGGTPLGEELRAIVKHSKHPHPMTPEAELMLMNACRAQLVREVILPSLRDGEIVLCDRFADSTVAYQGFGREMGWDVVKPVVDLAVGGVWPDRTLLLFVPVEISEARRESRDGNMTAQHDRFEAQDRAFFQRVETGFRAIAHAEPQRVRFIDASRSVEQVSQDIWSILTEIL